MGSLGTTRHERIDHKFQFDQLSYDAGIHYQPCVKVSVFFKKLPHVSDEHFFNHWATVHADITVASKGFHVYNIQRYTQHHQTKADREALDKMGFKTLDYDGCSTLWCRSLEDFGKMMESVHAGPLGADTPLFLDDSTITVMAGHDVIAFGKAIPDVDDQDGVIERPNVS